MLNLVCEGEKLISIVLFGLPELSDVIALDPPLAQRVDIRVELRAMEREEASAYLRHRLECAGAGGIMSSEAIDAICRYSAGVPRVLNTLADNALFEGFVFETNPVDASIVSSAADDLGLCGSEDAPPPPRQPGSSRRLHPTSRGRPRRPTPRPSRVRLRPRHRHRRYPPATLPKLRNRRPGQNHLRGRSTSGKRRTRSPPSWGSTTSRANRVT